MIALNINDKDKGKDKDKVIALNINDKDKGKDKVLAQAQYWWCVPSYWYICARTAMMCTKQCDMIWYDKLL